MNKKYCIICEKELIDGSNTICADCLGTTRWVSCECCGREFETAERDFDSVLDSCPYCGKNK